MTVMSCVILFHKNIQTKKYARHEHEHMNTCNRSKNTVYLNKVVSKIVVAPFFKCLIFWKKKKTNMDYTQCAWIIVNFPPMTRRKCLQWFHQNLFGTVAFYRRKKCIGKPRKRIQTYTNTLVLCEWAPIQAFSCSHIFRFHFGDQMNR